MIIVGEKLNSSIPRTGEAIRNRDKGTILDLAKRQLDGGADWLDMNAGVFMEGERYALLWMIDAVQRETGAKIMIDSQNAETVAAALAADSVGDAIINSVTLDGAKLDTLLPLAKHYNAGIVALPISPSGMPKTPQARLANVNELLERITAAGIEPGRVYIDPLVGALSADSSTAMVALETIRLFRAAHPEVNILCGLSNISYGLPNRPHINAAFLAGVILAGANAAILDTTDPALVQTIAAAEALSGTDPYCQGYLSYCRRIKQ